MEALKDFEAATLYFSGVCNLNCSYCFQPKLGSHMRNINEEILEWINSGRLEKDILRIFGDKVKILSLWGGEPTVNLIPFANRLKDIKKVLPEFREVFFSTNISTKKVAENIIYFLKKCNEIFIEKKEFKVSIQFSLDGPSDFNDCARIGSYSSEIVDNISIVLAEAEKLEMKNNIIFSGKATHSKENIQKLSNYDELLKYFKFFDDAYDKWSGITDIYPKGAHNITLVSPGNYTKEDGEAYLKILKNIEKLKKLEWKKINNFSNQLESRILNCVDSTNRKNFRALNREFIGSFNCSAGDGFLGLSYDGNIHVCQSSFFIDEKAVEEIEKRDLISDFEKNQGYSFRNFDKFIKNKAVINFDENELGYLRLINNLKSFREGMSLRIQYYKSMIPILVATGDILEKYKDSEETDILAYISAVGGFSCPTANIWEFGSYWIFNLSILKLLGNGVLDSVLKERDY